MHIIFTQQILNLEKGQWHKPNLQAGSSGNASGLDSKNTRFEYRMGH
jgi:hypothetical protein